MSSQGIQRKRDLGWCLAPTNTGRTLLQNEAYMPLANTLQQYHHRICPCNGARGKSSRPILRQKPSGSSCANSANRQVTRRSASATSAGSIGRTLAAWNEASSILRSAGCG